MIRRFFGICFALLLVLSARAATAEEFIASFDSAIQLEKSGAMTVAETITVNAEGDRIRRGIFRDFPLTFRDASGRRRTVDFSVVSVKRDGRDEPWHTESITGGIRIYAGSEDVTISPGRHEYVFTYKTNRQIRYFDDHDELYWNVTGNGWIFPIRSAVATVTFPQGVVPEDVTFFTGPVGATGKNARASVDDGRLVVATTAPLGAEEGLTFAAKLPKGAIDPPSADQESSWWLSDNRDYLIGFGGLILVFLYYTRSWLKVGRDPAREIVVPRWDPPSGISPALVNYIDNKGFSGQGWTALSATALDLAVRGYVTLEDLKDSIVIRRTDKPLGKEKLQAGEAELLKAVGRAGDTLTIDKANGEKVKSVGQSFRSSIEREHRGKYYNSNAGYITGGVILSAAALVALFVFGSLEPDTIALMIIPIGISVFLSVFVAGFVKALHRGRSLVGKIFRGHRHRYRRFCGLEHSLGRCAGARLFANGIPRNAHALCGRRHRALQHPLFLHHGRTDAARCQDDGWCRWPAAISDARRKGPDEHGRRAANVAATFRDLAALCGGARCRKAMVAHVRNLAGGCCSRSRRGCL